MGANGTIVSTPKADFTAPKNAARFPRGESRDMAGAEDLLVHFKIASRDPETCRRAMRIIESQLAGQRVGNRAIAVMITDDSVEMTAVDKQKIATLIAPMVASALGITMQEPF